MRTGSSESGYDSGGAWPGTTIRISLDCSTWCSSPSDDSFGGGSEGTNTADEVSHGRGMAALVLQVQGPMSHMDAISEWIVETALVILVDVVVRYLSRPMDGGDGR